MSQPRCGTGRCRRHHREQADDHAAREARRLRPDRAVDEREAVTVGGDHAHAVGPQHELRAVQEVPRVFAGDRETRVRDEALERGAGQRRLGQAAIARRRREFRRRQRLVGVWDTLRVITNPVL